MTLRHKKILFLTFCIGAVIWLAYRISVEGVQIKPRYTFKEQYKYKEHGSR